MDKNFLKMIWVGLIGFVIAIYISVPNKIYDTLEYATYDTILPFYQSKDPENRVVLVDIDDKSLAEIGAWPWDREKIATLINTLTQDYEVAILGVDIVFPESKYGDERLSQALNQPNVVFGQLLDFNVDSKNRLGKFVGIPIKQQYSSQKIYGYVANNSNLITPESQVGHITPTIDADGKIRRLKPFACFNEICTTPLGLKIFEVLKGLGNPISLLFLDKDRALWIPYKIQTGGFHYISAKDVIHHLVSKDKLKNIIVILGSSAIGVGDIVATPTNNLTPGSEIHAQLITGLLDEALLRPYEAPEVFILLSMFLSVILLFSPLSSLRGVIITGAVALFLSLIIPITLFTTFHVLIPFTPLAMSVILSLFASMLVKSFYLNRQIEKITIQFSRFIPESLVKALVNEKPLMPGNENTELTILVADMRGFTTASEGKPAEAVAMLAQKCLEALTAVVSEYGGTIEKYSGDGLMAIWGAPVKDQDHAKYAVLAGMKMQIAINELEVWFNQHGFKPMRVSVGINSGEAAAGLFGGKEHLAWSAHGDCVNVASRIEQLTRTVGKDILLGERTAILFGLSKTSYCGAFKVKGRIKSVKVYTPT